MNGFTNFVRVISLSIVFGLPVAHATTALQFENNVPADVRAKVQDDMSLVDSIIAQQSSPLHEIIYGKVNGSVYSDWFAKRIAVFGYGPDMMGGAIAYNISAQKPNHMVVTDYFVKGNLPQVARIIVLFHEARHSERENGFWTHVTCPDPFKDDNGNDIKSIYSGLLLAGKDGCDRDLHGAYGSSSIMMENISRFCKNCSEKIKLDADLYSRDQVNRLLPKTERQKLLQDDSEVAP